MKKIKRILAVILLILMATIIGYLVFTGNRLTAINNENLLQAEVITCLKSINTIMH